MTEEQDSKEFKNHEGDWTHEGTFLVEIITISDTTNLPDLEITTRTHTKHRIKNGKVVCKNGSIDLYTLDTKFNLELEKIIAIRDGDDNLLWANDIHR